ncbi:hypothetical protein DL93DRAFT_2081975 [Clavulina sp. PMI_390]|nr:hypothetical protein DL93DRAFT_2081975 [Clavulina sp. PMI_390]
MLWKFAIIPLMAASSAYAQGATLTTITDDNNGGVTEVLSISSDGLGDFYSQTISTIQPAQTSATTTLSSPTASGTALPPFSSLPVQSGTILAYSDFTHTAEPSTTSTASTGGASRTSLGLPPLFVPAVVLGAIGFGIALL